MLCTINVINLMRLEAMENQWSFGKFCIHITKTLYISFSPHRFGSSPKVSAYWSRSGTSDFGIW